MYGLRVPDLYFNNVNKKFCTAWILSPYEHFRVVILGKKPDFYVALGVKYIEFHMGVKLEKTAFWPKSLIPLLVLKYLIRSLRIS